MKWPNEESWNFTSLYGEPDLIIKTPNWKQPGVGQDAWYKPVVESGLTEPRWVRCGRMWATFQAISAKAIWATASSGWGRAAPSPPGTTT